MSEGNADNECERQYVSIKKNVFMELDCMFLAISMAWVEYTQGLYGRVISELFTHKFPIKLNNS